MFINPSVRHVFLKFEVRHIKDVRDKSFNRWSIMMQNMVSRFYSWLSLPTGNRRGLIIKPGKYQRSTQRCQHVSFAQYGVSNSCVLCTGKAKKENKEVCQVLRFLSINYGQPQPTGTSHCFYPSDLTYLTLTGLTGFL